MYESLILLALIALLLTKWQDKPQHEPVNDERASEPKRARWENFAIWSLVVVSFAALFFCFYYISAKCRGTLPPF